MLGTKRGLVFAALCFAMLAGGCLSATAAEWIDTSRLPRVTGAKDVYGSAATTIFTSPDSVAQTAEAASKALGAGGWQAYGPAFAQQAKNPDRQILSFKKGPQALSVFITIAPAQGNATSVQYTAVALANDLPFPKDATDIEFDPDRPHLNAVIAEPVDQTLDFFRRELGALGWSIWSMKDGANPQTDEIAGVTHQKGAYAYYVRDPQRPFAQRALLLVLQNRNDGRAKLELKTVPAELLMAQSKQGRDTPEFVAYEAKRVAAENQKAAAEAKAKAEAEARFAQHKAASDQVTDEFNKLAQQMVRDAMADVRSSTRKPTAAPASAPKGSEQALRALATSDAPIPVPETAEEIEHDAVDGKLDFSSASSVQALAAFYRGAMTPLGWKEKTSVVNRPNMAVLRFSKTGKELSFTIMQMGPRVTVRADGSGLVTASAKPAGLAGTPVAAAAQPAEQPLEAEEMGGLPIPTRHSLGGTEKTPFRITLNASVPAGLAAVLDFYRRELGKRDWKEESQGAVVKQDQAVLAFASPDGPAVLKLDRKNDETVVSLALKKQGEATNAGMLPKAGQAKLLFGSMVETETVVTINKQTIRVGAGVGGKKPDGPSIDLPPGKYKYAFRVGSKPAETDEVEVRAGDTWGMLIGPGGALALQVY